MKIKLLFTSFCLCAGALVYAWQPVGDRIKTQWAEEITPDNVWSEYPRPVMERGEWQNLNGLWKYAIQPLNEVMPVAYDGEILVPFAVESSLSGVGKVVGPENALWYNRKFRIPGAWKGKDIILNFGAVDWKADVWVNDVKVGAHTGGYTPFSFNITSALKKGENTITVKVWDGTDTGFQPRGKQVANPRGIWYTSVTGIWQTVWLEPVNRVHIESMRITPDIDKNTLSVAVNNSAADMSLVTEVKVLDGTMIVGSGKACNEQPVVINMPQNIQLWTPRSPKLYDLEITLYNAAGKPVDYIKSYAAMRKFSIGRDDKGIVRLQLNNQPLFQFGPLDQGWWPDGLYTPPCHEAMAFDIDKTKDFGFNMIRKHVKVEPALWYTYCDRNGIIVWQDMPSGDSSPQWQYRDYFKGVEMIRSPESEANYWKEWKEIIDFLYNNPSIAVWVPFNEAWGQFKTSEIVEWTKTYDSTRLVNPASGGNFYDTGDILDIHNYPGPAMYLFDEQRANALGEYGGIGLAVTGHLWAPDRNWGYVEFKTPKEVTDKYVEFAKELKKFADRGFSAAVYTQITDVEVEVNGLITYDRKVVKVDEQRIRDANEELYSAGSVQNSDDNRVTKSGLNTADFISVVNNKPTSLYVLTNKNGAEACITNYGGRLVSLMMPDKNGKFVDVVLGHESIADYVNIDGNFGALIGRYGNRINNGQFSIDDIKYQLPQNNYGHCLHGGPKGFHHAVWDVENLTDSTITLSRFSHDGEYGFPGDLRVNVKYTLTNDNAIEIDYSARTNKPTIINLTNHSYFNLSGDASKDILDEIIWFDADGYTPIDSTFMTTGEIMPVSGTPFDFTSPKAIGASIGKNNPQLANGLGYDHNMVLRTNRDVNKPAVILTDVNSGIIMELYTVEPGIQFYTGNFLDGSVVGKHGVAYPYRSGICLESQHFPNSPNNGQWPSVILRPGDIYKSYCKYKFKTVNE